MTHPQDTVVHGLPCPACGQNSRTQFEQPTIGKPPIVCTHCTNPVCPGYYRTLQIDRFYREFQHMSIDQDAINLITHVYPWLKDNEAADLLSHEPAAMAIAEALLCIEDFRQFVRDSGALDRAPDDTL